MHRGRFLAFRSAALTAGALGAGLVTFAYYFLTLNLIENDHAVIMARARQVLSGDWPVRDFIDPGMPLTYLTSAAAGAIAGPSFLTEAVLTMGLIAVAAAITVWLVGRATASVPLSLAAVSLMLAVPTRLYSATKVACIVLALWFGARYARSSTQPRLLALGVWTGLAFLVRFDYAVYVGAGAVVLIWLSRESGRAAAVGVYTAAAAATVLPWLAYVHLTGGVGEYLGAAIRFAEAERARTASGLPVPAWPLLQARNIDPAVFYAILLIPVAALATAMRMAASPSRSELVYFAVVTLTADLAFLRDGVTARIGDAVAATAVTGACALGRFTPRALVTAASLAALAATGTAALRTLDEQSPGAIDAPVQTWNRLADQLRRSEPQLLLRGRLLDVAHFIERCTAPQDRVLVSGFAPEIPVVARRAFAGGLPSWLPGYYVAEPDVTTVERHLAKERVGAVVLLEGSDVFVRSWPSVAQSLRATGLQEYAVAADMPDLRLWLRSPSGAAADAKTGLPCLAGFPAPLRAGRVRPIR